ncbi:membrane bound O-acyl transferase family-domain-containing protein [Pholiota molesta]|nr:membrane bound O-acyl transferase family-domain-containing protein [Pholiota molesta]
MRGKYDLNPNLAGLIHLIFVLALANGGRKATRFNELFFIPIALLSIHLAFLSASDSGPSDYVLAISVLTTFFTASDLVLLRRHQAELRMIGQKKPTSEMTFLQRLWWATQLSFALRGVGWAHEPTEHIAPHPTIKSRTRFITSQLLRTAFLFVSFDILSIIIRANPCFGTDGPSLAEFGWAWRTTVWLYPLCASVSLSMFYSTASVVFVALRVSEPRDWPQLFGSAGDAYTVRNCWGRVWHQMMRKFLTGHMNFFAQILRLPKSTFTTYFKLFGSFFISGLLHYGADYVLFQNWSGTSLRFFSLQAVAITFEDAVVALARRLGYGYQERNPLFKIIGFIWVFIWFSYSLPIWLDPILHAGTMDKGINVSLILGLWKGEWTPRRL